MLLHRHYGDRLRENREHEPKHSEQIDGVRVAVQSPQ